MLYLIVFDIHDNRKRRLVTKVLKKNGARIHRSVFLCDPTAHAFRAVESSLKTIYHDEEGFDSGDSIRIYPQCSEDLRKLIKVGSFQYEQLGNLDEETRDLII